MWNLTCFKSLPYLTSQLIAILHKLFDWRDASKLTNLELPLLPSSFDHSVPSLWGPSGWHSSMFLGDQFYACHGLVSTGKVSCDPIVVHTLKISKVVVCVFWWCFNAHWLFSQGTHIFICDMLWPHNSQDLSSASHIKRVQSGLISFSHYIFFSIDWWCFKKRSWCKSVSRHQKEFTLQGRLKGELHPKSKIGIVLHSISKLSTLFWNMMYLIVNCPRNSKNSFKI